MSDLRDAVLALADAVAIMEETKADGGGNRSPEVRKLVKRARDIAATVDGLAGKSNDV